MGLITPSTGLLFWMVIIFAIVFIILAKAGFPIITKMVGRRNEHIEKSLADAEKASQMLADMDREYQKMLDKARGEQAALLAEARKSAAQIVEDAKTQASAEAKRLIDQAKEDIEVQKNDAVNDVRSVVATLAVSVSEKILREKLSSDKEQMAFIEKVLSDTQGKTSSGESVS